MSQAGTAMKVTVSCPVMPKRTVRRTRDREKAAIRIIKAAADEGS
jgi:hypothetical protein